MKTIERLFALFSIIVLFSLLITNTASASDSQFVKSLGVGSSGQDVVNLQDYLIQNNYLTIPAGVSKGRFGGLTRTALIKFQKDNNIKPTSGYFGPLTRNKVNGLIALNLSSTSTVISIIGTSTASSTIISIAPTSSNPTVSLGDVEGTLDVRQAGSPANNSNIQTSTDIPVFGLTLKATIAPVQVDRFDLSVKNLNGSSYENPANLINTIKAWSGTTLLKTWNVTSADFIKNPNDSTEYYIRMSGIGLMIGKDETKDLTFSVSTNSGIDTSRVVTLKGYGSNSLRVVSGNNIVSYYSASGFSRTQVFNKVGNSTVAISEDPLSAGFLNVRVKNGTGAEKIDIYSFKTKAEGAGGKITDVTVNVTASGTLPSTVYLYDGDTVLDSRVGASSVTFSNLNIPLTKDEFKILYFKVDMPENTATGTSITIGEATTTVSYIKDNGGVGTITSNSIYSWPTYFYSAAPEFTFDSANASTTGVVSSGSSTGITATFKFKIKPHGANMNLLTGSDITATFGTSTDSLTSVSNVGIDITPNHTVLSEETEYNAVVTAVISNTDLPTSGMYTVYITGINWTMSNGVSINQDYDFTNYNYRTNPVVFVK